MGYSVHWHSERRVFVVQAWGDISLEELTEISEKASAFVQSGDAPVHWIVDTRQISNIPKSINQIQKMAHVFQEPKLGWILTLTENRFLKFATSLVSQLSRVNYKSFQDPEALISSLEQIDPTLINVPDYISERVEV